MFIQGGAKLKTFFSNKNSFRGQRKFENITKKVWGSKRNFLFERNIFNFTPSCIAKKKIFFTNLEKNG
jgi:hypothetical protein